MSSAQIIEDLFFNKDSPLSDEFHKLFTSLFDHGETMIRLIKAIATKRYGVSRDEIIALMKLQSGGTITSQLHELKSAGFVQEFVPYGKKSKEKYFRINDEFTSFYLTWIEGQNTTSTTTGWVYTATSPKYLSWLGYAFENFCLKHISQIQKKLGLDKMSCVIGSWRKFTKKGGDTSGTQIDLLFDRGDKAITLCEIKFSDEKFVIDKPYAQNLKNKILTFSEHFPKKDVFLSMISPFGIKKNIWSEDLIEGEVLLKDMV